MTPVDPLSATRWRWLRASVMAFAVYAVGPSRALAEDEQDVPTPRPTGAQEAPNEPGESPHQHPKANHPPSGRDTENPAERIERIQAEIRILEARLARARAEVALIRAEERLRALVDAGEGTPQGAERGRLRKTPAPADRQADAPSLRHNEPADPVHGAGKKRRDVLGAHPEKSVAILETLEQAVVMPFPDETPLGEVIKYIRVSTRGPKLPSGVPVYVDPASLQKTGATMDSKVKLKADGMALKRSLGLILKQVGLTYRVNNGLLWIDAEEPSQPEKASTDERQTEEK